MVNMIIVSIMLLNMLIAHLSNSYGDYQKDADIRFSIDKAWMVSKLDHSIMKVLLSNIIPSKSQNRILLIC